MQVGAGNERTQYLVHKSLKVNHYLVKDKRQGAAQWSRGRRSPKIETEHGKISRSALHRQLTQTVYNAKGTRAHTQRELI